MARYLVIDIGCLECGESTDVVGIFDTPVAAQAAVEARAGNESGGYFLGGQRQVEVFTLEAAA